MIKLEKLIYKVEHRMATIKLGGEEITFSLPCGDEEIYGISCQGNLVGLYQPSLHNAYVLKKDGEIISIFRTYKNMPISIHLDMVELGVGDFYIAYKIDNKYGETGLIPVSPYQW